MAQRVLFHVGFPKTGSTSIQRNLFQVSPSILDLSGEPAEATREKTFVEYALGRNDGDVDRATSIWHERIAPLLDTNQTVIISSEDFAVRCSAPEALFQWLATLAPAAEIIAIVRDQVGLIRSLYDMFPTISEDRASCKTVPFSEYLDWALGENAGWFDRLKYSQTLTPAVASFGRERVHIFSYSSLFGQGRTDVPRFAEALGVTTDEIHAAIDAPPENQFELHAVRRMMRTFMGPVHASWFLPLPLIQAIKRHLARSLKFERTILSATETERIKAYYAVDNASLMLRFPEVTSL